MKMAGGRKGSHKGKSHQKKKENSCESIEETTCAASEASLFLATPSNPAKRCRTEETDEFNPEETLKFFESMMQKGENKHVDTVMLSQCYTPSKEKRCFLYFNHLSKELLEQWIPHLKALI